MMSSSRTSILPCRSWMRCSSFAMSSLGLEIPEACLSFAAVIICSNLFSNAVERLCSDSSFSDNACADSLTWPSMPSCCAMLFSAARPLERDLANLASCDLSALPKDQTHRPRDDARPRCRSPSAPSLAHGSPVQSGSAFWEDVIASLRDRWSP